MQLSERLFKLFQSVKFSFVCLTFPLCASGGAGEKLLMPGTGFLTVGAASSLAFCQVLREEYPDVPCKLNQVRPGQSTSVWEGSRIWIKCNRFPLVPVAGEDQRRRSRSRADGSWLPEPPGPGRSCRLPGGEERHLPHGLHHQLPRWPKNRPSGEEPVDSETPPCGHRGVCSCSDCVLFSHDSKPSSHNVSDLYIF